jgi:hypothetical protein
MVLKFDAQIDLLKCLFPTQVDRPDSSQSSHWETAAQSYLPGSVIRTIYLIPTGRRAKNISMKQSLKQIEII